MREKFGFWKEGEVCFLCGEFYRGHDATRLGDCRSEKQLNIQIIIWNEMTQRVWPSRATTNDELDEEGGGGRTGQTCKSAKWILVSVFIFSEFDKLAIMRDMRHIAVEHEKKKEINFLHVLNMYEIELEVNLKPLQCRQLWGRLKVDVFISRNTCWHRRDS